MALGGQPLVAQDAGAPERVLLTAGRSTVLTTEFDITRIAVTNPAIADAVVVRAREVLVDGKGAGTVSLIVWGADTRKQYDVVVDSGVTTLQQNLQQLFPGENINVGITDEAVILSGTVSNNDVILRSSLYGENTVFTAAQRAAGTYYIAGNTTGACDNDAFHNNMAGNLATAHRGGAPALSLPCADCHKMRHSGADIEDSDNAFTDQSVVCVCD